MKDLRSKLKNIFSSYHHNVFIVDRHDETQFMFSLQPNNEVIAIVAGLGFLEHNVTSSLLHYLIVLFFQIDLDSSHLPLEKYKQSFSNFYY